MVSSLELTANLEPSSKFDDSVRLHARVRREFRDYCNSHQQKLIEINEVKLLKCNDFEGFIVTLIKRLQSLGYFGKFKRLEYDLVKAKGIFPVKLQKSFLRDTLYLDFIFKNQRGLHEDDLEVLFRLLEVESYGHAALQRGFTVLFDDSPSNFF